MLFMLHLAQLVYLSGLSKDNTSSIILLVAIILLLISWQVIEIQQRILNVFVVPPANEQLYRGRCGQMFFESFVSSLTCLLHFSICVKIH